MATTELTLLQSHLHRAIDMHQVMILQLENLKDTPQLPLEVRRHIEAVEATLQKSTKLLMDARGETSKGNEL